MKGESCSEPGARTDWLATSRGEDGQCRASRLTRTQVDIRRAGLIRSAPGAQLTVAVRAPALDRAVGHKRARVVAPHDDGGGFYACTLLCCGGRGGEDDYK